ncbi:gastrula zinc finger protein XlCGF48.2-like [Hyperolius riggenbachi]|uniref:gastrula zinc finger protein XlCGF48.2-like n=1 Tax=Hyperolius riggenbachi TaxID=752182 RepID=UPI0035A32BC0
MDSKLGQVGPTTNVKNPVSRSHNKFRNRKNVLNKRKDKEIENNNTGMHKRSKNDYKTSDESIRFPNINSSSHTVGNDAYETLTKLDDGSLEQNTRRSRKTGDMPSNSSKILGMVVVGKDSHRRQDVDYSNRKDYHNRCESFRLGSASGREDVPGFMAKEDKKSIIQLQRVSSNTKSIGTEFTDAERSPCSSQDRQHHSSGLFKSARGDTVKKADGPGHEHINNSGRKLPVIIGNTSERVTEHDSRLSEQTQNIKFRNGNIKQDVQEFNQAVGSAAVGHVRKQEKHKVQEVLLFESKRRSGSSGCAQSELDIRQGLCFSTNTNDSTCFTKIITDQSNANYGSPGLARKKLVSTTTKNEAGGSSDNSAQGSTSSRVRSNWKLYTKSKPVSLASERSPLRRRGVSERVIKRSFLWRSHDHIRRMEKDWSHVSESILNLTLEIIYLLTGEGFPLVKPGDHVTITLPLNHSLECKKNNKQMILEVIKKIIELLTGEEVGELLGGQRDEDTVMADRKVLKGELEDEDEEIVMEEWQYLEGHKALYKDFMMKNVLPLTSPDGSSNRSPHCAGSPYSQKLAPEDDTNPHYYESEKLELRHISIEEEETDERQFREEEELMQSIKEEVEEDETYDSYDQQSTEEGEMMRIIKEEEDDLYHSYDEQSTQCDVRTLTIKDKEFSINSSIGGRHNVNTLEQHLISDPEDDSEDNCTAQFSPGGNPVFGNAHHRILPCPECSKFCDSEASLALHLKTHASKHPLSCSECGKCFRWKSDVVRHQRVHNEERPYACSECKKSFKEARHLQIHQRVHTVERPFSCTMCDKNFTHISALKSHLKVHTGEKPFSCPECGKCFIHKGSLFKHQKIHTECGKGFSHKGNLHKHQRTHTGERPFSCSECDKCFTRKEGLLEHQKKHSC